MRLIRRLPLLLGLLAVVAFSPALAFGFVYDDAWTIVDNAWLERPLGELFGLLSSGGALARKVPDATRPAMVLSLWLDRRLFGLSPVGHHLTSLALYGLTTFVVTRLALRLSGRVVIATAAGAFFALAPLHAEPVAAVNYREDLLSALGVATTWLLLVERGESRPGRTVLSAAALAVALFAKESSIVIVPLVGITLVALPHLRERVRRRQGMLFALGAVLMLWALWRVPLFLLGDDIPMAPARGAAEVLLRTLRYEVEAVKHAALPFFWSPDRFGQPAPDLGVVVPFAALVFGLVTLARRRATRLAALGVGIALVSPLGSSPLLGPSNELADRYFFLGVLGGGLFWGFVLEQWVRSRPLPFPKLAVSVVFVPMLIPAYQATRIWKDERSVWTAAVERSPHSTRALAALSRVERMAGNRALAATLVERALTLDPKYAPALVTRIYNELDAGEIELARAHLAELPALGATDARGVKKARRCAALDPAAARACIRD
jgi:4-amino-4-deoxy-L-arabinose transferase-like glycosyltransferase